jgi:medium-chain acyl-[acyl-carrier-protein] hydrolase
LPVASSINNEAWVVCTDPKPNAHFRLFCFPYMGGGASVYSQWGKIISDDIEVCAIQYPGREERANETIIDDKTILVDSVTDLMVPLGDKDVVFYGHSFGAGVCIHVANRLLRRHVRVSRIFAGAFNTPELMSKTLVELLNMKDVESIETLPPVCEDELIINFMRNMGVLPEMLLADQELMRMVLPVIRAELTILRGFLSGDASSQNFSIPCPMTVFAGINDPICPPEALENWRRFPCAYPIHVRHIMGDHLFIHKRRCRKKIINDIEAMLLDEPIAVSGSLLPSEHIKRKG